jgi:GTP pyrophosphokinase
MLAEYDACVGLYTDFGPKAEALAKDVLAAHNFRPHSVAHRVKERSSMERKLNSRDKPYGSLSEVTDLLGVRVITHFPDEVDTFAAVLLPEFDVLEIVDRRQADDPRQFGYASLHCIVRLDSGRRTHLEYRRFADCVLELQIRSILQHAWAEIEHDLGYKTSRGIPRELRRRFSRLSGLLELADEEFRSIRDASRAHAQRVEVAVTEEPGETSIDQDSLISFLRTSPTIAELDAAIGERLEVPVDELDDDYAGALAEPADVAGFETIGELESALDQHKELLRAFSGAWLAEDPLQQRHESIPWGISLFHLFYLVAAEKGPDALVDYCRNAGWMPEERAEEWAPEVYDAIGRILGRDP